MGNLPSNLLPSIFAKHLHFENVLGSDEFLKRRCGGEDPGSAGPGRPGEARSHSVERLRDYLREILMENYCFLPIHYVYIIHWAKSHAVRESLLLGVPAIHGDKETCAEQTQHGCSPTGRAAGCRVTHLWHARLVNRQFWQCLVLWYRDKRFAESLRHKRR